MKWMQLATHWYAVPNRFRIGGYDEKEDIMGSPVNNTVIVTARAHSNVFFNEISIAAEAK